MKGIILAGGNGTRLYPMTKLISKQLIPVYDKPMIYYPLATLMLAGIRDILIITTPQQLFLFEELLSDGRKLGIHITYAIQPTPGGIAQAFLIGASFIGKENVVLILGDNIFYGDVLTQILAKAQLQSIGAHIFGYYVSSMPHQYGVLQFNQDDQVVNIVEKPSIPPSNYAVTGLYYYDYTVVNRTKKLIPSHRGELEITDVNKCYLADQQLHCTLLPQQVQWFDAGTSTALLQAAQAIAMVEQQQHYKIACIEEIAFKKKYITQKQFKDLISPIKQSAYGNYLYQKSTSNQ